MPSSPGAAPQRRARGAVAAAAALVAGLFLCALHRPNERGGNPRHLAEVPVPDAGSHSEEATPATTAAEAAAWSPNTGALDTPRLPPTRYLLGVGAGTERLGEVHARGTGFAGCVPRDWMLEYRRRWPRALRGGWRPTAAARAGPWGTSAALRWSRSLLGEGHDTDATGLDLHLETSVEQPRSDSGATTPAPEPLVGSPLDESVVRSHEDAKPPIWRQRVEVVLGPEAQAKYLNMSLPVAMLLGAVFTPRVQGQTQADAGAAVAGGVPISGSVYFHFEQPGLRQLRGWVAEATLYDSWAGCFSARAMWPWARKGGAWFVEHFRTHAPVRLPKQIPDLVSAVATATGGVGSPVGSGVQPAAVPSSRLHVGSDGVGVAGRLESAEAGLGGAGWGGDFEVATGGWGARLHLAGPSAAQDWGQLQYALQVRALWGKAAEIVHELKLLFEDRQGLSAEIQHTERGPRLRLGLEVR